MRAHGTVCLVSWLLCIFAWLCKAVVMISKEVHSAEEEDGVGSNGSPHLLKPAATNNKSKKTWLKKELMYSLLFSPKNVTIISLQPQQIVIACKKKGHKISPLRSLPEILVVFSISFKLQ